VSSIFIVFTQNVYYIVDTWLSIAHNTNEGARFGAWMNVRHKSENLDRLERDSQVTGGFPEGVVEAFRARMNFIRQAVDERDFRPLRSWNFEKLRGDRDGQWSIRLNKKYRLIVEIEEGKPKNTIVIVEIVDYH